MESKNYIDSSDSETESNLPLELNDQGLIQWLRNRTDTKNLTNSLLQEFSDEKEKSMNPLRDVYKESQKTRNLHITRHIKNLIDVMYWYYYRKKRFLNRKNPEDDDSEEGYNYFDGDLYRHEIAVYLNTECGMIYDIATCVAEYANLDYQNKPFISYYNS